MYTEFAKCLLMENEEFEMVLYNGTGNIACSTSTHVLFVVVQY